MKIRKLFTLFLFAFFTSVTAQVGNLFPDMKGKTLNEAEVTLPAGCKGKITLICLAYSKKAEEALQTWMSPLYNKFVLKRGMMDDTYDVNLYFIPMFTGVYQPTENMAKKQLKEGTDKQFYDNIICYHGGIKAYKEPLGLTDRTEPYFFILDKNGKIIYTTFGLYSEQKMDEIEEKLE